MKNFKLDEIISQQKVWKWTNLLWKFNMGTRWTDTLIVSNKRERRLQKLKNIYKKHRNSRGVLHQSQGRGRKQHNPDEMEEDNTTKKRNSRSITQMVCKCISTIIQKKEERVSGRGEGSSTTHPEKDEHHFTLIHFPLLWVCCNLTWLTKCIIQKIFETIWSDGRGENSTQIQGRGGSTTQQENAARPTPKKKMGQWNHPKQHVWFMLQLLICQRGMTTHTQTDTDTDTDRWERVRGHFLARHCQKSPISPRHLGQRDTLVNIRLVANVPLTLHADPQLPWYGISLLTSVPLCECRLAFRRACRGAHELGSHEAHELFNSCLGNRLHHQVCLVHTRVNLLRGEPAWHGRLLYLEVLHVNMLRLAQSSAIHQAQRCRGI